MPAEGGPLIEENTGKIRYWLAKGGHAQVKGAYADARYIVDGFVSHV
jgi:hypothetical protein